MRDSFNDQRGEGAHNSRRTVEFAHDGSYDESQVDDGASNPQLAGFAGQNGCTYAERPDFHPPSYRTDQEQSHAQPYYYETEDSIVASSSGQPQGLPKDPELFVSYVRTNYKPGDRTIPSELAEIYNHDLQSVLQDGLGFASQSAELLETPYPVHVEMDSSGLEPMNNWSHRISDLQLPPAAGEDLSYHSSPIQQQVQPFGDHYPNSEQPPYSSFYGLETSVPFQQQLSNLESSNAANLVWVQDPFTTPPPPEVTTYHGFHQEAVGSSGWVDGRNDLQYNVSTFQPAQEQLNDEIPSEIDDFSAGSNPGTEATIQTYEAESPKSAQAELSQPAKVKVPCPDCGNMITDFKSHRKNYHSEKTHKCSLETCSKSFRTRKEAERHEQIHKTIRKRFVCPVCGLDYARKDLELRHEKKKHPRR